MKKQKGVIQTHHISYVPEIKVTLYKGEHWVISLLERRKRISKGFVIVLKDWIQKNEPNAKDIE